MALGFRGIIASFGPSWLTKDLVDNGDGTTSETDSRLLYTCMLMLDALDARLRAGRRAALPGLAPEDALQWIGRARNLLRGPEEDADTYAERLSRAWDDWLFAGIARGLLSQVRAYCFPHAVRVRIVNNAGRWYTLDRDGTFSRNKRTAWNWDNDRDAWSRFWVIVYPTTASPSKPWSRGDKWGDAGLKWGTPGKTWGSTATSADVFAIRRIVRDWKPMGSTCVSIIVSFDDTAFDPTDTAPPLPDGTWKTWGRYGVVPGRKTPARFSDAIYWRGTGDAS